MATSPRSWTALCLILAFLCVEQVGAEVVERRRTVGDFVSARSTGLQDASLIASWHDVKLPGQQDFELLVMTIFHRPSRVYWYTGLLAFSQAAPTSADEVLERSMLVMSDGEIVGGSLGGPPMSIWLRGSDARAATANAAHDKAVQQLSRDAEQVYAKGLPEWYRQVNLHTYLRQAFFDETWSCCSLDSITRSDDGGWNISVSGSDGATATLHIDPLCTRLDVPRCLVDVLWRDHGTAAPPRLRVSRHDHAALAYDETLGLGTISAKLDPDGWSRRLLRIWVSNTAAAGSGALVSSSLHVENLTGDAFTAAWNSEEDPHGIEPGDSDLFALELRLGKAGFHRARVRIYHNDPEAPNPFQLYVESTVVEE